MTWLSNGYPNGTDHIILSKKVKDSDNYRLVHAYTGKQLDPTNVDKLIHVEPWAIDNHNNAPNVDNEDQPDQSQQPDLTLHPSDDTEADFSVGDFAVFEQQGSDLLIDDDVRTMITILYNWLLASPSKQAPTSEACKHLYSCNLTYKKLLKSIGGIRKLLYHTASIEFVLEQATGSNNFIRVVGVSPVPLFNFDRLGGKYAIGEISFVPNANDAYEILPHDRKSKKSSWDKPLFPIIIDGQ